MLFGLGVWKEFVNDDKNHAEGLKVIKFVVRYEAGVQSTDVSRVFLTSPLKTPTKVGTLNARLDA